MQGIGVARIGLQDLAIERQVLVDTPGLMQAHGLAEAGGEIALG